MDFAAAIAAVLTWDDGWIARTQLTGCWPVPAGDDSFGKGSSCIVGTELPVSCAEVEFTCRARVAGFTGGWMNGYNPSDRRFPSGWRQAVVPPSRAHELIRSAYPGLSLPTSGMPDLIL